MTILIKGIIVLFLISIVYALASALYFLIKDTDKTSTRLVKALSWRIGLSFVLFILLMVLFALGYIQPHPVIQ